MTESKKALEMIRQYPDEFDLVITDQAMPVLPGKELAVEILKVEPEMPIIMVTGYSDMVNKPEAQALGIADYLHKPYKMSELSETVRTVLDNSTKTVREPEEPVLY